MSPKHTRLLGPLIRKFRQHCALTDAAVDALEDLPYNVARFERGRYLVREGERPGDCFAILDGFIYRSKITSNGARQILALHLRGDLVCAHDRLLGEADHNIQALTDLSVASIPQDAVLAVAEAFPDISRALWRDNLVDAAVSREWLLNVGRRNARERLSHAVCEMALRQEAAGLCSATGYTWPMTQEELGDALGLTSVHVNRTVRGLRRDGIMKMRGRTLTVMDWESLQAEGDFRPAYLHQAPA